MKLELNFQKKQKEAFYKSLEYPVFFFGGAKGGGKSWLVRAREIYRRMKYPQTKGLIVRKTYPELLSNHIRRMWTEYPITKNWFNKSEKTIYWPNGSVTEFSYLKNTDDVYTYQGREYEDISIDEITQHEETVFKILRSSNRTSNKEFAEDAIPTMLLTGNPGGVGHQFVKRLFIDRRFKEEENPDDYGFLQAKVYDNHALLDADPEYVQRLKSLPEKKRKAYLEGDWDVFEGQVFAEWRRSKHVISKLPYHLKDCNIFVALDWGYNDPTWVGYFAVTPESHIILYRELYDNAKTPEEWAEEILLKKTRHEQIDYFVLPPDCFPKRTSKETIKSRMADCGIHPIRKADNDRLNGWSLCHSYLAKAPDGRPWFQVLDRCRAFIETFPQLVYDDSRVEDVDTDLEDHPADGVRYGLMSRPDREKSGVVNKTTAWDRMEHKKSFQVDPVTHHMPNPKLLFEKEERDWRKI